MPGSDSVTGCWCGMCRSLIQLNLGLKKNKIKRQAEKIFSFSENMAYVQITTALRVPPLCIRLRKTSYFGMF